MLPFSMTLEDWTSVKGEQQRMKSEGSRRSSHCGVGAPTLVMSIAGMGPVTSISDTCRAGGLQGAGQNSVPVWCLRRCRGGCGVGQNFNRSHIGARVHTVRSIRVTPQRVEPAGNAILTAVTASASFPLSNFSHSARQTAEVEQQRSHSRFAVTKARAHENGAED